MKKITTLTILIALIAGISYAFIAPDTAVTNKGDEGVEIGDKAPGFTLKNVNGKTVSLSDYTDKKGVILTFTCNTCPYSVMYEDRLNELHKTYAPKGYPVVAINPNDPAARPNDSMKKMKERAEEKNFDFVYLQDKGQKVYPKYGATRTPHVFLLDKELTVQYIGAIDNNAQDASAVTETYLEDAIVALEAGKKPDPNFTKAIGCTIKTVR